MVPEGQELGLGERFGHAIGWHLGRLDVLNIKDSFLDFLADPALMNINMPQGRMKARELAGDEADGLKIVAPDRQFVIYLQA